MFFWRADIFSAELWHHLPKTAALLDSLPKFGSRRFASQLAEVFPQCENISVDFAVLEVFVAYHRADRSRFEVTLQRAPADPSNEPLMRVTA